ncbi:isocitrate/isopropylmalate dehydrogenase family protein [Vulgatibacter incomptus]|nr:isocitrate/isopropylmalate dehydrogenase family protein [Vulgatibacter incomptus]
MSKIAVIPGDGIGKEVAPEGAKLLEQLSSARGLGLELEFFDYGADRYLKDGTTLPPEQLEAFRRDYRAILFGAVGDPRVPDSRHAREILLALRFQLDLYVNLRPVRLLADRFSPLVGKGRKEIDGVFFRENTEGVYVDVGGNFKQGTADEIAITEDVNSRKGVERICRAALDWARKHGEKTVWMSDKSNAMRHAGGLWQRVWKELARDYPDLELRHMYVDVLAMQMVLRPELFRVVVTNNLFGDILTDLGAGISGGLGFSASANLNPGKIGLFEPVHGSAPDIVGTGKANPIATFLTCALLLEHLGHDAEARIVEKAVDLAVAENVLTPDVGGSRTTSEVSEFVRAQVARLAAA